MRQALRIGLAAAAAVFVGACDILPPDCSTSVEPAIVVFVREIATGESAAAGARGAVRDGAYTDSLRPFMYAGADPASLLSFRAADERPGTYEVTILKDGYAPWVRSGVRVTRGTCHVNTVTLDAFLERMP